MAESVAVDPAWAAARTRWRTTADRLWSIALVDETGYRRATEAVGAVLAAVREVAATPADLLAVDARPDAVLEAVGGESIGDTGLVVAAACATRADEIEAEQARVQRAAVIDAARAGGQTWALVAESTTRSVRMHLRTGLALVVIDDPYRDREPYGLGEVALVAGTGEPLVGHGVDEEWFAGRADRDASLARRRAEIESLDDGSAVVSDG